ncbi:MAG TPA: hydroxysqualene dehydroxylase HpnE [Solirubrobacteraceae bacterium]|jgi:squalene-associated FAD-dependent desaturase|nr:hydroxysqualene dehydroxylase HpnE [Solirubrobacteraceae bacterium]
MSVAVTTGQPSARRGARGRVTIVGGGLAGITAALDCAGAGAQVTLLESRPRLGGAAYSVERGGLSVDNGQHVFLRCCTAYRGLLERIGGLGGVTLQSRLAIPVLSPGSSPVWLRRTALPAPLHLASSLVGYRLLTVAERIAAARAMTALRGIDYDDPAVDAQSFGAWLRAHGQTPRAIERLWELIARPTLNLVPDDASLAQAAYVFQTGLLRQASAGDIGWARVPLSEIHDAAARRALSRAGVEVSVRMRAEAIVVDSDGGFQIEASGRPTVHADVVILAVPHDRIARLAPPSAEVPASVGQLGASPIVNLHVVYDRRVLELPFAAGVDTPVQWVFDRTESAGLSAGQYLAVSLSAAEAESAMTVQELRERYLEALAELLPGARDARVEQFFVTREHAATFRAAPGARAWRPGPRTRQPGLVLAGSWTDTGWPATMEGAVRSGTAAAREAVAALAASERTMTTAGAG